MANVKILGFAVTVLLFIAVVAALGGPVVPGADENPEEILPDGNLIETVEIGLPFLDTKIGVPNPAGLLDIAFNLVGLYQDILNNGGPIVKGISILMLLIIAYEFGNTVLTIIKDVIPLT